MNTWREAKKWLARRSRIGETRTSAGSGNGRGRPGVCPRALVPRAPNSCRRGTLHSVLPLYWEKPGADFAFLLLANHAGQIEQAARDDQALHLARALPDRAELGV